MGATWKVLPVVSQSEHLCTMSISLTLKHKPCLCNLALQPSWWLNGVLSACQMRVLRGVMVIYPLSLCSKVYTFLLCHLSFWVLPVGGARGSLDGRKRDLQLLEPWLWQWALASSEFGRFQNHPHLTSLEVWAPASQALLLRGPSPNSQTPWSISSAIPKTRPLARSGPPLRDWNPRSKDLPSF